jgi:hypothetical protein
VRWSPTICLTCLCFSAIWAQQQETSLVDRLLRPDMELQNKAQGKKFVTRSAAIEHRGSVGTFLLQPNRSEKSFVDSPTLTTTKYPSSRSLSAPRTISSTQNRSADVPGPVGSSSVRDIHTAYKPDNASPSRIFADQHQFREQGKSQKSLDRQNPPLTIDQVRELLNKNK